MDIEDDVLTGAGVGGVDFEDVAVGGFVEGGVISDWMDIGPCDDFKDFVEDADGCDFDDGSGCGGGEASRMEISCCLSMAGSVLDSEMAREARMLSDSISCLKGIGAVGG